MALPSLNQQQRPYEVPCEIAKITGYTTRWVQELCNAGAFPGAYQSGSIWLIPVDDAIHYAWSRSPKKNPENRGLEGTK